MSEFNREEWESGPPEDKSERLQGIRHLNEPIPNRCESCGELSKKSCDRCGASQFRIKSVEVKE